MTRPPRTPTVRPADDVRNVDVRLRRELVALGYDDRGISRLVRGGELVRVRRGAYVDAGVWPRLDDSGRYGARTRAVLKQARTGVVASHVSALPEYGAPLWGLDLADVHVTRTDERSGRREAGVRQHCGVLVDDDWQEQNGILVSSPARAALEVATVARLEPALVVLNHLLHEGWTTLEAVAERYQQGMDRWPRSLLTDVLLRLADARIESPGESRLWFRFYRGSIPMPVPQLEVVDPATGEIVAALDFAWPELGVWAEFDGLGKYLRSLRPGEDVASAVLREKRREDQVRELTSWRCIRVVWQDLAEPERLLARVRGFLRSQAA